MTGITVLEMGGVFSRGGTQANALAVRAECRESLYDFEGAASDFDELQRQTDSEAARRGTFPIRVVNYRTPFDSFFFLQNAGARAAGDEERAWRARALRARELRDATHYVVLGVAQKCDEPELRRAYRRASMRWHPDRQSTACSSEANAATLDERARAERHFRRINDAKETLLDAYKRAVYDVENRRRLAAEADARSQPDGEKLWSTS